jgi:hypothetical protein
MSYTENVTSPSNGAAEADEAKDNSKIQTDLKGICKIIGYIDDEVRGVHKSMGRAALHPVFNHLILNIPLSNNY